MDADRRKDDVQLCQKPDQLVLMREQRNPEGIFRLYHVHVDRLITVNITHALCKLAYAKEAEATAPQRIGIKVCRLLEDRL